MANVYVRPAVVDGETVLVRDPEKGFAPLPADGAWVRDTDPYWGARIRDADVAVGDPPPADEPVDPPSEPDADGGGTKPRRKG